MSPIPYAKMDGDLTTSSASRRLPSKMSIVQRLQKVDPRVWFFCFVVGGLAYDVTKIEYLLQFGFKVNTIHIPLYLIVNAFLVYTAITNHLTAVRIVKIYSLGLLIFTAIVVMMSPVWMIYEFSNGAPEHIRMMLEHGDHYQMDFGQSLAYCIFAELSMIVDAAYYAVQLFLAHEVLQVVKREQIGENGVEMSNILVA